MLKSGVIEALGVVGISLLLYSNLAFASYNAGSPLGTNTNEVTDDDSSAPFVDLFKSALPFEDARPWMTKGNIEYDQNGWPRNLNGGQVGTRFLSHMPVNTIPDGYYTVMYEGQGKIQYGGDAKKVDGAPGFDVVEIRAGDDAVLNASLRILATDPNNHLRNIRILLPGGICADNPFQRVANEQQCRPGQFKSFVEHHKQIIFNPAYMNYMKDFSVIRFMNMSGITRNEMRHWRERPTVNQATWGGKEGTRGAPIEIMVELANRLNAHPWFTLPHNASDEFVRRYAQYVRKHLRPNLKPHIEYSNETWNTIFSQGNYVRKKGLELRLDTNAHRAGYRYYSQRSVEIFKIWQKVYGGSKRLVRILAGWTVNPSVTDIIIKHNDAYKHADAFAIAPYFFGGFDELRTVRNVNDVFNLMTDPQYRYSLPKVLEYSAKQQELVSQFGLDLIAYEGGQGLVDFKTARDDQYPNPLLYKANRDPRIQGLYTQFLNGWKRIGGKAFAHYSSPRTYRKFGSWGTKEYITQPVHQAPKYRAILDFIKRNPCWWEGCSPSNVAQNH